MEYSTLGSTGVAVSRFCLGTMMFGPRGNPDRDDCARIVDLAFDAGVNFIDTADVYGSGESERIVGKALRGKRDDVVLATKFSSPMGEGVNARGGSRRWVIRAVEDSLRRLQTDYIDLYQMHRPDWMTDVDDTLGALSDLVHQGKVRIIGSSTFSAESIVECQWAAERRGRERFRCEQPPYSILTRSAEVAVLPTCRRYGMGVITWSPLAGGWLTGRIRDGAHESEHTSTARAAMLPHWYDQSLPQNQRKLQLVEELTQVATAAGLSLTHMSMAWSTQRSARR